MRTTRFRINSLIAVIAATATMFSYCLTSQALESYPDEVSCVNTLDLSALSESKLALKSPNRFISLLCGHESSTPRVLTTTVGLRSLNP
jgi:hypothetical protein